MGTRRGGGRGVFVRHRSREWRGEGRTALVLAHTKKKWYRPKINRHVRGSVDPYNRTSPAPPSPIDPRRSFLRGPRHSAPRVREPQPPSRLTRSRAHAPRLAHDDGASRAPIRPRRGARRGPARGLGRAVRRPRAHARAPDRAQGANRARPRPRRAARVHRARRGPHRVPDRVPRAGVAPRYRPGRGSIARPSSIRARSAAGRARHAISFGDPISIAIETPHPFPASFPSLARSPPSSPPPPVSPFPAHALTPPPVPFHTPASSSIESISPSPSRVSSSGAT